MEQQINVGMEKKKVSALRIVNIVLTSVIIAVVLSLLLVILITKTDKYNKLWSYVGISCLFAVPYLAERILRVRFSDFILTFFLCFAFIASILGNVFRLYNTTVWFDKVVHFAFGYVGCLIGLLIICKFSEYQKLRPVFIAMVCFAVSLMCGAVWEIFEFCMDVFMNQTAQGVPVLGADGSMITPVTDTMLDIVCNFGGAIVFLIHYLIHRMSGKNLLILSIVNDFSKPFVSTKKIAKP